MFKALSILFPLIVCLASVGFSNSIPSSQTSGITPISDTSYLRNTVDLKQVQGVQSKSSGLGKLLTWVSQKADLLSSPLKKVKEIISNEGEKTTQTHWGAIAGFISGVISIFIAGIPLGLLAIIFSSIALNNIKKYPVTYSGKGLAIAGLILGILGFIGAIYVLTQLN